MINALLRFQNTRSARVSDPAASLGVLRKPPRRARDFYFSLDQRGAFMDAS